MPARPCVRCKKPTRHRRSGRPTCPYYAIVLDELRADNQLRRVGKLEGTRGRC